MQLTIFARNHPRDPKQRSLIEIARQINLQYGAQAAYRFLTKHVSKIEADEIIKRVI